MHELSLVSNILEIVEDCAIREGASAIRVVSLRVGANSGVEPEALEFAFEAARQGTLAQDARLEVEYIPLRAFCDLCALEFDVSDRCGIAICPSCHRASLKFIRGEELEVRSLEVV
jgi:hydrogenase nickel incorporation protein HypA/HybF